MKKMMLCTLLFLYAGLVVAQNDSLKFGLDTTKGYYLSLIRDGVQDTLMLFLFHVEILDCKTNKDSVFYITKASWGIHYCAQRIKKEKVDIRREKDIYTFDLYKKDIVFYKDIIKEYYKDDKSIKTQILKSVEDYNDNIRVGAEFFIPTELLVIIFNIYKKNYNNTLLKNKIIKNI
jgi:hypothetical protein